MHGIMKYVIITVFIILMICLGAWFFERALISNFTIGKYTYVLSSSNSPAITGRVIWEGLQLSLRNYGIDPNNWNVSSKSEWQINNSVLQTNNSQVTALIILNNETVKREIYVRVKILVASNILDYYLSKPK
jgi:hypothetical protein